MSVPPRPDAMAAIAAALRDDGRLRERLDRRLPLSDKLRLGAEIVVTYVRVRRGISSRPLPELLRLLRGRTVDTGMPAALVADEHVTALRLARSTMRTLRRIPGDTRCLTQSLVLTAVLARRGIGSKLLISVSPGNAFAAHAWVEHGGIPVLPAGHAGFWELTAL